MMSVFREADSSAPLAITPAIDFAIVLSRTLADLNKDPAQLRNVVYQLARIKLEQEVAQRNSRVDPVEMKQLSLALESAIDRVETIYSKCDNPRLLSCSPSSPAADRPRIAIEPPKASARDSYFLAAFLRWIPWIGVSRTNARSWQWQPGGPLLRAAIVMTVAFALFALLDRHFAVFGRFASAPIAVAVQDNKVSQAIQLAALQPSTAALSSQSAGFALPTVYGVYAVNDGQLHELEPLVGRVPDERVFMSTPIRTPSRTTLADGRIAFIIYRRDAANSAPDRVTVRVIAKIMRSMTFATAGPVTTRVEDSWTIRNLSHELRVAPVHEGSEMLMIRPENPNFVFPAGRYGLVIKGQAYDFTVAGPVTEPAQCLEGVKAANGTFYSECRRPSERQL